MYQNYFGLAAAPFSIAPDPRYLYMSPRHQEALATLLYGMNSDGGFVLLTGEVGAGKTTICRCLLEQVPDACDVAYIFNPKLTVIELLTTICDEFGIPYPKRTTSIKRFVDLINAYLLDSYARGRRAVLIIDEAQNLSVDVLEQMRLLTNLETDQRKLLQILLIGQPELVDMLARQELRQLSQRIIARYHLMPLNKREVMAYVKHRLEVAGAQRSLFPDALFGKLYKLSGGVPRIINLLCDRALLGTFVQGKERVDRATLAQAASEVLNQPALKKRYWGYAFLISYALLFGGVLILGTVLTVHWVQQHQESEVKLGYPVTKAESLPIAEELKMSAIAPASVNLSPDKPGLSNREMAFVELFRLWGMNYQNGAEPCTQAEAQGLICLTTKGGLDELRQFNLPAMLHLQDDQGHKYYATLTNLDATSATLIVDNKKYNINHDFIAQHWSGVYSLLFRQPRDVHENMQLGESGPSVEWLSKQLAQVQGRKVDTTKAAVFDLSLKRQVKRFQFSQGLTPDGVAGPRTLARLSALADQSAPRLSSVQGRK